MTQNEKDEEKTALRKIRANLLAMSNLTVHNIIEAAKAQGYIEWKNRDLVYRHKMYIVIESKDSTSILLSDHPSNESEYGIGEDISITIQTIPPRVIVSKKFMRRSVPELDITLNGILTSQGFAEIWPRLKPFVHALTDGSEEVWSDE